MRIQWVLQGTDKTNARLFSGSLLPPPMTYQGQTTIALKDTGAGAQLTAERLADGRYRLDLHFSDGSLAAVTGNRPSLHMLQCNSALLVRSGETVPFASGVDPQTGDMVEVEATVEGVRKGTWPGTALRRCACSRRRAGKTAGHR